MRGRGVGLEHWRLEHRQLGLHCRKALFPPTRMTSNQDAPDDRPNCAIHFRKQDYERRPRNSKVLKKGERENKEEKEEKRKEKLGGWGWVGEGRGGERTGEICEGAESRGRRRKKEGRKGKKKEEGKNDRPLKRPDKGSEASERSPICSWRWRLRFVEEKTARSSTDS